MASMSLCRLDLLSLLTVHVLTVSSSGTGLQERRLWPDSKVETYPADSRSKTIKSSDAAFYRSLRSVRDSVVYGARVHCLVQPHLRPSGVHKMWCWRDTRARALVRLCLQVLCPLSSGSARLWSTGNWIRSLVCFKLGSKVVTS